MNPEIERGSVFLRLERRRRLVQTMAVATIALFAGTFANTGKSGAALNRSDFGGPYVGFDVDLRTPNHGLIDQELEMAKEAGANAVNLLSTWSGGQGEAKNDVAVLTYPVEQARADGLEPFITYTPCFADNPKCHPPLTAGERSRSRSTIAYLANTLGVRHWIIGNEVGSSNFWRPQFDRNGVALSPAAYANFLADSYDELKRVSSDNEVICGNLASVGKDNPNAKPKDQSISPLKFIAALGAAYRAMGRTTPLCDTWGQHPYGETPTESPQISHANGTLGWADHDQSQLEKALSDAFKGTAQPTPPIANTEYGVDTASRSQNARVSETTQGVYYQYAIGKAACRQEDVFIFKVMDESNPKRWQSGVFRSNHQEKLSFPLTQLAIGDFKAGSSSGIAC